MLLYYEGAVRLYVSHTLCISCLAACAQFLGAFPRVPLFKGFKKRG